MIDIELVQHSSMVVATIASRISLTFGSLGIDPHNQGVDDKMSNILGRRVSRGFLKYIRNRWFVARIQISTICFEFVNEFEFPKFL